MLIVGAAPTVPIAPTAAVVPASAASPGAKDVMVHLFQWPWASIANECTTVLAAIVDPVAGDPYVSAVTCGNGWECEHRTRTTANMVALRNVAAGAPATNWWTNGSDQIGFGRGAAANTAFNRGRTVLNRTFQTGLPAGTYCDVMNGDLAGRTCSGPSYTVDASGQVGANVPTNGALALHIGARMGA